MRRPAAKPEEPKPNTGWIPVPVEIQRGRARRPSRRSSNGCRNAATNSMRAPASSKCARAWSRPPRSGSKDAVAELKELEARINNAVQTKEEGEAARFKNLVTMYENMKAKEAAKIFDRLDTRVLFEVATQITPRRMSDILAQMSPEAAERLTLALAARPDKDKPAELPKIEGKPSN